MATTKSNYTLDLMVNDPGQYSLSSYVSSAQCQGHNVNIATGPDSSKWGIFSGNPVRINPIITTIATGVTQSLNISEKWSDQNPSQVISLPQYTDSIVVSNFQWHISNPSLVTVTAVPTIGYNFTPVSGAGGGVDNAISIYATVTVDNIPLTSPTYWMAVDNSTVTGTNVVMTVNSYSDEANGLFVSSTYYSLDNVNWISLGSSASIPQGSTVYLKGVYSSTQGKHWTFNLSDPSNSFSHSGITSSYTLQSSGYAVGSSNFNVFFEAMLYGV